MKKCPLSDPTVAELPNDRKATKEQYNWYNLMLTSKYSPAVVASKASERGLFSQYFTYISKSLAYRTIILLLPLLQ